MGTPSYATTILEALCLEDGIEVSLLVTQQDKPVGRKQILTPPHTKAWVLENGLHVEIYQPKTLRTQEAYEKIASLKPDFIVVAAYGQILPKAILDIAPCINLHASLLPKYRGASPIQASLLSNDVYTGVTSMLMEEGLDTGAMLGFSYLKIDDDNVSILFEKLAHLAAKLTLKTLQNFYQLLPLQQVDASSSHCKKIKKEDGLVSFEIQSAEEIDTKFKALTPWPGLFLDSGLKLLDMQLISLSQKGVQGTICALHKEGVQIFCKEGVVMLKSVQPFSKSAMNALDYIRGKRLGVGDILV